MQELEKILEEIEGYKKAAYEHKNFDGLTAFKICQDIIRNHVNRIYRRTDMQELEKILEEIKRIKDGNRKEKLYAKYPPDSKNQEVLNAYSQGYEDGTDNFYNAIVGTIRKHMNDGWIPVKERLPEDDKYILLSFENFSLPMVGRYDKDAEGGAFYLGDCDEEDTCISMDLLVNAWMPLPEPYRPETRI